MKLDTIHRPESEEPIWHVQLAVIVAIMLQVSLGTEFSVGPKYLVAAIELMLLFSLALISPKVSGTASRLRRGLAVALVALISLANIISLVKVLDILVHGGGVSGQRLIFSAVSIFLTNIIMFGVWYWELDGGGAGGRGVRIPPIDFLFPQMQADPRITAQKNWQPTYFDYLYLSITNATAFSPTDTMPLTHRAKLLMTIQSLVSLATIALVAARAVNILS